MTNKSLRDYINLIESDEQGVAEGSLNEFAPGQGGNGDDGMGYLHALAQAWYTHDLSRLADIARKGGSPLKKIIDAQEAVEKILSRGVHCPDGKVRKYYIDYTADFDGVDMVSHDYYEHSDYGPNDEYVDGRTGKPWSAYDHIEFSDDQLDEGVAEGSTTRGGFGGSASQAHHEIEWLKNKIETLKPLLAKKPSVARQIKDLERQIRERELAIVYQKEGVAEGSLNESDKFTSWYDWKDQAKSSG